MKCPHCGSNQVIKAGKLTNKYVTRRAYRCKGCKRYFVERDGFENKSYPKEIILQVLHLYVQGLSLSNIREFMWQHRGYRPADSTILDLVRHYSKLLEQFERRRMPKPSIKGRIHLDEVELKVGKKKIWCINTIDSRTKYNLGTRLVWHRSLEELDEFFRAEKPHWRADTRGFRA